MLKVVGQGVRRTSSQAGGEVCRADPQGPGRHPLSHMGLFMPPVQNVCVPDPAFSVHINLCE